jgi:hypothetical protein
VDRMMSIENCQSCGYPKFGPGLCAYCLPAVATDQVFGPPARLASRDAIPFATPGADEELVG